MAIIEAPPALLVSVLLLFPLLIALIQKCVQKQNKNLPPSPPKLPFIGNLHQLGSLPHQSLCQLSKKYGSVMLLHLGNVPSVIISSAEAAKQVMKTHDLSSCSRPQLHGPKQLTYNFQDLAFSPYGKYWRELRKIYVLEVFSVKRVNSYNQLVREEEVAKLVNSISHHSSSSPGAAVDLTKKLYALTASIIFRTAFGTTFKDSKFSEEKLYKILEEVVISVGSFCAAEYFPYVGWIVDKLSGLQRRRDRTFHEMDGFFQRVIDDHLSPGREKQEHEDIVDVLLKIVKEQTGFGAISLTINNIKAVLLDMFVGGIDTAAITMVWAMAELVRRPKLMKKAQDEVRTFIGNKGNVSECDIEQLQYLKMIMKETLRLHPPAAIIVPRETMSHFTVNGYDINPKTMIQVNAWAIGRDPNSWKDPEEFIPERFEDSPIDFKGQHFELLPFGSGRRTCPAMYMGTTIVQLGLANLLYSFDWKLPDGMKEQDINMDEFAGFSLTISKRTPLKLVPEKPF
ncbi:LOW QUALITY PROTEIN: cytochrome P450 71B34 [Cannabis sativa]|uniref:LOW QUALITY PROTEIN: cytochrome P450 71B34 n=1 Tax=Cannabis sativa TaxID=3483 RepID=UPI0029CA7722|nr:LOW QUALITY PROTEIN: cytochrome P450 71B34 [Cannabis sativa]